MARLENHKVLVSILEVHMQKKQHTFCHFQQKYVTEL